jgi:cyclase
VLTKRLIACFDVVDGRVTKAQQFQDNIDVAPAEELAERLYDDQIDEIVFYDITASAQQRKIDLDTVRRVARHVFVPFTVGGGIRSEDDAAAAIDAGADKVSLNTAALRDPELITTLARRYGSQAVIVAIDAKRRGDGFAVYVRSGTADAARDAVEWAREAERRGAGEILLTSMDRDGTKAGFDCEMTAAVSSAVDIPVIASGGAGTFDHFTDVFTRGRADAALAASIFHYAEHSVTELKHHLRRRGVPVRL